MLILVINCYLLLKTYHVASQSIFKVTKISKDSGISYQSCLSYTKTLEENGLLFSNEKQRNKTYYNYEMLNLVR